MTKVRPLSEALMQKAIKELYEDPATVDANVQLFRNWVNRQTHMKARTDSQFLVAFLRTSKFNMEDAKHKLEAYYTARNAVPELFSNRSLDDARLLECLKLGGGLMLPKTNGDDGPRISIIRAGCYDPKKYHLKEIIKAGTLVGDIQLLEDDNMVVCGLIEIMDLADVTVGHLMQMDASFMRKLVFVSEGATPLRHRGLHFINTPPGFDTMFNFFKTFLGSKSKTKLFSHGRNIESLYEHVPRELLPVEYGGDNSSVQELIEYWQNKVISYKDYFAEEHQYGIVDECRINNQDYCMQNGDASHGAEGTFRSLTNESM